MADEESQSKRRKKEASEKKESRPETSYSNVTRLRPPPIQNQDMAMVSGPPLMQPVEDDVGASTQLFSTEDHPQNKKGFRYVNCTTNPSLSSVLYTQVEVEPCQARLSYEDRSPQVFISTDCTIASTAAGFRSARANVGVREGDWFCEFRVLRGNEGESDAHVRLGWTRREASLEAPVGHDAYGYGLRDVSGEKVHLSRPLPFMKESFTTGDVIGFWIHIPRDASHPVEVVRDRIPIRYKGQLYFECLNYVPTKQMDDLLLPMNPIKKNRPQKFVPSKITGSFIRVFKNGKDMGVAFEDLIEFLPPHSKFQSSMGALDVDDGEVGYFPTISVFKGGMAKINFGPEFEYVPEVVQAGFSSKTIKPLYMRYDEQIAEDVTYDVVDQVDYEILDALEDERLAKLRAEQERQAKVKEANERIHGRKVEKNEDSSAVEDPSGVPQVNIGLAFTATSAAQFPVKSEQTPTEPVNDLTANIPASLANHTVPEEPRSANADLMEIDSTQP
jgi:COMPASS component BRE2